MNKRKFFILTVIVFSIFLFGCQSKKQTSTTPAVTVEHVKGTFDFDTVLANTTINNRRISSNSKFKDLGKEFTLGNCYFEENNKFYILHYEKEDIGGIILDKSEKILYIRIENDFEHIYGTNFDLCGINFDSNLKDVLEKFGEPSDSNSKKDILRYGGEKSDSGPNIMFAFSTDYYLYAIEINMIGEVLK
ncbi:MAG: hypothetical protein LBM93_03740 [Oscillospiraceae bacterium]|jgi:hypothetical protein|nr:hypothetical protein [Oscillospiraceae bacterium]